MRLRSPRSGAATDPAEVVALANVVPKGAAPPWTAPPIGLKRGADDTPPTPAAGPLDHPAAAKAAGKPPGCPAGDGKPPGCPTGAGNPPGCPAGDGKAPREEEGREEGGEKGCLCPVLKASAGYFLWAILRAGRVASCGAESVVLCVSSLRLCGLCPRRP